MNSARPVLIYGAGIHLSGAENEARDFAHYLKIPIVPTWGGLDILPSDDPLVVGSFGTHGTRAGNFAVQNATSILAIGTRLDSKATGTPIETFARSAHITMVDIDPRETEKFNGRVVGIHEDAKHYLQANLEGGSMYMSKGWVEKVQEWKQKYPVVRPEYYLDDLNPYVFIDELSKQTPEDTIICTDTGCAVAWVSQAWRWKKGQRFIHSFNQTPMGYGLPAAIGSCFATGKACVLITGDGSLMMNIGELATVSNKQLPVKIFMFNNQGHGMCRQTQREWFGGTYPSTSIEGGLTFPNFVEWARYAGNVGITSWKIEKMSELNNEKWSWDHAPTFCEVMIDPEYDVLPKVKYGHPNEDGHPLIDISKEMLIPLWTAEAS